MKKPTNLVELTNMAFRMDANGTKAIYPQFNNRESVYYTEVGKSKRYDSNNGIYSWVEDGSQHVCPYFCGITEILSANGYSKEGFFVPFSNGEYPLYNKRSWETVLEQVKAINWADTLAEIKEICAEKGVGDLPGELLSKFRVIPRSGIVYTRYGEQKQQVQYPLVTGPFLLNFEDRKKLGCYNDNNGQVVVHANDGNTYLASLSKEICDILSKAGYSKNSSLWVPFSNGEVVA